MLPIVCVVGKSNSGKTTLLASLVPELKALGYHVATVKHVVHGSDLDVHGKDSWRLLKAGSDVAFVSGPGHVAQFREIDGDLPLKDIAASIWDCDILLAEGYKDSPFPKVEVVREELGLDLLCKETELAAVVSESELPVSVRRFQPKEVASLAKFIADTYIEPDRRVMDTELSINGQQVALNTFAKHFFARATLGMASVLKGIGKINRLVIYIKNNSEEG